MRLLPAAPTCWWLRLRKPSRRSRRQSPAMSSPCCQVSIASSANISRAASHWIIRGNLISDFIKAQGDQISYGAYAKGAGSDNRFEQNIVLCESLLRGFAGQRVGLSLGGGGTGKELCRDKRCITEQDGS